MKYTCCATVAALASLPSASTKPLEKRDYSTPMIYGFDQINATADLTWKHCFDTFTCAKLEVPLDYEDESAGTTYVSFIKWSSNSTTAEDILVNPGGPGGTGVSFLLGELWLLQEAFGTDNNFVGFDPRGVNNSGPDLSCFPGKKGTGTAGLYPQDIMDPLDANDTASYGKLFARATALGEFCTVAHSAANDTAKYANTVATATDMLHYTELLAQSKGHDAETSQLWYYGISYGTVLGTTFAALFPDRVGRMIVDGVVDGEDYYGGKWESNLFDADEIIDSFFQTCYDAGEGGNCTFWADSPAAIKARYQAIVDDLSLHPLPVSTPDWPAIVTEADLKIFISAVPYYPLELFPALADVLVELEKGNGTVLAPTSPQSATEDLEPQMFIFCADANGRSNFTTYESWVEHAKFLVNQSHYVGEAWSAITTINCRKLDIRAPTSQVLEWEDLKANHTSNPLLFVSSRLDPVTPLRGAEKIAARFGDAQLLVQESAGHWSLRTESQCTYRYLREYIKDASLPVDGTVCQADRFPFRDEVMGPKAVGLKKRHVI